MKLKAVVTRNAPADLIDALNSPKVADAFRDQVAIAHLRVDPRDFGPATHYVQESDLAIPNSDGRIGIEVTLSKVSTSWRRSGETFLNALSAVEAIYVELIERYMEQEAEVQLFCVLALDDKIKLPGQEPTSLVELPARTVEGRKLYHEAVHGAAS